jgi:hypothetical protein
VEHHWKGIIMLTAKIGAGIGLAAALLLGASPALAAGWTIIPARA